MSMATNSGLIVCCLTNNAGALNHIAALCKMKDLLKSKGNIGIKKSRFIR
jgi:hypothetical protein